MSLQISGKNMDLGEALRGLAEARIASAVGKYFDGGFSGQIVVEREGSGYRCDCTIRLDTGATLRAEASGQEAVQSFERAAERIEKRLRRYKGRLKSHHANGAADSEALEATAYVLAAPDEDEDAPADDNPVIIAEEATSLKALTVGGAVMALDLADSPVLVFRHAGHGGVNVVYRRADGNIGWIDPSLPGRK